MSFRPSVSHSLMVSTALASVMLLVMGVCFLVIGYQNPAPGQRKVFFAAGALALGLLIGSLAFRIRSYEMSGGNLIVKVGFGEKLFPLTGLEKVEITEAPFSGAWRTLGVGGLWSYYGRFRSAQLGAFRAYATSSASGVLLVWPDKKVLITPQEPEQFLQAMKAWQ
ncbi:MAG TPA: PH domain-containing protein [Candidatus Cybelea sp.]|nr:PH domain-containing protein [Candidatus Cybelea sp.]